MKPPLIIIACTNSDSRSFLDASYRSLLRSYIYSPSQTTHKSLNPQHSSKPLIDLLSSPRIKHVDLNYIDDQSGTTLLHEAAKRKNLSLLELSIRAGADVFVRDRNGRPVYDASGTGKDDQVRVFLRQCESHFRTFQLHPIDILQSRAMIPHYWPPRLRRLHHPPSKATCTSTPMSRGDITLDGSCSRTEFSPVSPHFFDIRCTILTHGPRLSPPRRREHRLPWIDHNENSRPESRLGDQRTEI